MGAMHSRPDSDQVGVMNEMKRKSGGRRAAILAIGAAALTALVAAFVVTGSAAAPISWVDQAGAPLPAVAPIQAQRLCRAADLQIRVGRDGAFHGWAAQELVLTNTAGDACALAGPLAGAAVLDAGGERALAGSAGAAAHRLDLAPGQTARMLVGTPGACAGAGNPVVASSLRLAFDTGETAAVSGVWLNVECGAPRTVLFSADAIPAAAVPASGLRATLTAPSSVGRGRTLSYVVTLANPTANTITLGSCPSYTEWLGSGPSVGISRTLRLNCGAAPRLGPGQSVAFEMRLSVPQNSTLGPAKLSWHLEVPDGAGAGTTIGVS